MSLAANAGPSEIGVDPSRGHLKIGDDGPEEGVHMPRSHPPYPPECRAEAVRLARSGERTPERLSHDQACSAQAARADGLTTAELEEPGRLRREVRMLR
jgi:hypothetical protein